MTNQAGFQNFDAITSINSGQVFLWENAGNNTWYGIDRDRVLKITLHDGMPEFSCSSPESSWEHDYFRLDDNMESVRAALSGDRLAALLFEKYPGLRLLRQDPEQCLFSFVCASNTNIPMIRMMLYNITRKFGQRIDYEGREFFTFPSAHTLAKATMGELGACSLGYRAKAVRAVAVKIASGSLDLQELRKMEYGAAKDQLLQVYGIGNKIADCILLFCLDKLDAFPIDVWIARGLSNHYQWLHGCKIGEKLTPRQYETISGKMRAYFGAYAGYAQQYLYYDIRQHAGRHW